MVKKTVSLVKDLHNKFNFTTKCLSHPIALNLFKSFYHQHLHDSKKLKHIQYEVFITINLEKSLTYVYFMLVLIHKK